MKLPMPCAIYTRKSTEDGLEQGFNSLDAQREACEAYVLSQKESGWKVLPTPYDDGGFSGGNTERPALSRLLADIAARRVKIIVVYKVDRLTRSLADFAKLVELFDAHDVSFVSVTQQFNTTSSMGRLTLNVLLSFAQFEREVTGERIRDKIAASKRKGMWMGGPIPIGYQPRDRTLVIDEPQAAQIREIYRLYLELGCVRKLKEASDRLGWRTPVIKTRRETHRGGRPFSRGHLYRILGNPLYKGQIAHKGAVFPGQHPPIIDDALWQAVQERLKSNGVGPRHRSITTSPSLLTGFLFDGQGNRVVPTHSKKGAKRYRYYVAEQVLTPDSSTAERKLLRWPAQELEDAVTHALAQILTDQVQSLDMTDKVSARDMETQSRIAESQARQLCGASVAGSGNLLSRLVARIILHQDRLEMAVRTGAIGVPEELVPADEAIVVIEVPVELKRCGKAVRLILRTPDQQRARGPDPTLVALLGKAHAWFAKLTSGAYDSVDAIAREAQVSRAYVTRIINLAFLAPDVVQRIVAGRHPLELNARRLIRMGPIPMDWNEQRQRLGMAR